MLALSSRLRSAPKATRRGGTRQEPEERARPMRGRRPPPRARRPIEPRTVVLPDAGLTTRQLAALAGATEARIVRCAKELDGGSFSEESVLPAALVELVSEELLLPLKFLPQTKPLLRKKIASATAVRRMPVVTVMGHVDHGKTSLLDALRDSNVAEREAGGITQSVAAFRVPIQSGGKDDDLFATFIDTPGHAAFKAMRANGTIATDIVVLVVAADDGVMPQSIEAGNLARAADVPLVVAVNKCDVAGANPERVRYQLLEVLGINTEQIGGDVQCVEISAKTRANLPMLLEAISLQADMLDLQSDPASRAAGICLESRMDRSMGSTATVVVRSGTLRLGDHIVFQSPNMLRGDLFGRVRGLISSNSERLEEAGPGVAVGVIGVREPIPPGSQFCVEENERVARAKSQEMIARNVEALGTVELANSMWAQREEKEHASKQGLAYAGSLDTGIVPEQSEESPVDDVEDEQAVVQTITVLIKGDVQGSADAVAQCVQALGTAQYPVRVLGTGVGEVTDMDVKIVAAPRNAKQKKKKKDIAIIIAFNVRVKEAEKRHASRAGVEVLSHNIIYRLEEDLKQRLQDMEDKSKPKEEMAGKADVVRVFENGKIAGCSVQDGTMSEGDVAKVWRLPSLKTGKTQREVVFTGTVECIKHFAKAVRSVKKGSECGITLADWSRFAEGDVIECIRTRAQSDEDRGL